MRYRNLNFTFAAKRFVVSSWKQKKNCRAVQWLSIGTNFNFFKKYFQLILEAPDDITDVRFSVHDTHLIAATVHSGMILVWDVGQYESLFKGLPGAISAEAGKLPTTYPVAATLENSSGIARHIQWVPSYVEVSFST